MTANQTAEQREKWHSVVRQLKPALAKKIAGWPNQPHINDYREMFHDFTPDAKISEIFACLTFSITGIIVGKPDVLFHIYIYEEDREISVWLDDHDKITKINLAKDEIVDAIDECMRQLVANEMALAGYYQAYEDAWVVTPREAMAA